MSLSDAAAESRHTFVGDDSDQSSRLLQLPESTLALVLSQLDPCSLASTAATCTTLRHAVPANITSVAMQCRVPDALVGFQFWVEQHRTSLTSLTQCSLGCHGDAAKRCSTSPSTVFGCLPCTQLHQLCVKGQEVQLASAGDSPGVLQDCTGLTALDLQDCWVPGGSATSAAIAALTELQVLCLARNSNDTGGLAYAELWQHTKLTRLELAPECWPGGQIQQLRHLSALVHLEDLVLRGVQELPGGLPSQLVKLTVMCLSFRGLYSAPGQFKHLSSLIALQLFEVQNYNWDLASDLPGIAHLPQLRGLELESRFMALSTTSTHNWTCRTRLEVLGVKQCIVQPQALAAFTNLRVLHWNDASPTAPAVQLLGALDQLQQLTELVFVDNKLWVQQPPSTAYTAFTASTNLCVLQLRIDWLCFTPDADEPPALFKPGSVYPHLRSILLQYEADNNLNTLLDELCLQQLCSCCPALQSLVSVMFPATSATVYWSLLQLSALTRLHVTNKGDQELHWRAVVDVAAQLTGLKDLAILGYTPADDPAWRVLQLTALTALTKLALAFHYDVYWPRRLSTFKNKAPRGSPPDVWIQLLGELLRFDFACRQALLERSSSAAAAPAELMLAQLAATLAEELASCSVVSYEDD